MKCAVIHVRKQRLAMVLAGDVSEISVDSEKREFGSAH